MDFIKRLWIAITIAILCIITFLSLYPLGSLPDFPGSDKTHHIVAYSALMFPTALRKPKHWQFIGLCFICWSGLIELVQPYVNRYGEWQDLAANTLGIFCGFLIANLLVSILPKGINFEEKDHREN
ncbi:MAG: VanZ family protein [Halioglobus sp.]